MRNKIDVIRTIDYDKYHTFFLEFYKEQGQYGYQSHIVRPCTSTYDDIANKKLSSIVLESAVILFAFDTTLEEVIAECAARGIAIDFVDVYAKREGEFVSSDYYSSDLVCVQTFDMHKDDVSSILTIANAQRYYVATDLRISHKSTKYVVVDRFKQNQDVKFMVGEYCRDAVVAGFKYHRYAVDFCKKLVDDEKAYSKVKL